MKVLITGASSGMGYDMAKYLSTYNFDLFLVAKDKKELDKNLWLRLIQRRRMYKTLQRSKK